MKIVPNNRTYPYYLGAVLSGQEKEMRDFMMYDFNVSLKLLFCIYNFPEFSRYCFNCCRQTAILGAAVLAARYPDYTYRAFEGTFEDVLYGKPTVYEHAYIIATHKDIPRHLLIDLSRTTKPLLFEPVFATQTSIYPDVQEYEDMKLISSTELPLPELLSDSQTEYLTGLKPRDMASELAILMNQYANLSDDEQYLLTQKMYGLVNLINI